MGTQLYKNWVLQCYYRVCCSVLAGSQMLSSEVKVILEDLGG